jgi:hypothetical protein
MLLRHVFSGFWFLLAACLMQPLYGQGLSWEEEVRLQDQVELRDEPPLSLSTTRGLPLAVSLKMFAPRPGNQDDLGTCVGWAAAYAARTILEAQRQGVFDRQEVTDLAFSPGFTYNIAKSSEDPDCQTGALLLDALSKMKTNGAALFKTFPQHCADYIPEKVYKEAQQYTIQGYNKLWNYTYSEKQRVEAVKQTLAEGRPVVAGLLAPPSLYAAKQQWLPYENPDTVRQGHAVCIIGYDERKFGGAFEIMNSWGEDWGDKGFSWVSYADFLRYFKFAYEVIGQIPTSQKPVLAAQVTFYPKNGAAPLVRELPNRAYELLKAYQTGEQFRFEIQNQMPLYFAAFFTDASGKVEAIYPLHGYQNGFLPYPNPPLWLPSENHYFTLDNKSGTDHVCFLFSQEPIVLPPIIEAVRKSSQKTFQSKVLEALRLSPQEYAQVRFKDQKAAFASYQSGIKTVPLFVQWQHR